VAVFGNEGISHVYRDSETPPEGGMPVKQGE